MCDIFIYQKIFNSFIGNVIRLSTGNYRKYHGIEKIEQFKFEYKAVYSTLKIHHADEVQDEELNLFE
jgi:5-methylcytosine-specific restriction endonuclease McrBC GTP-binding regulatory subunit McrB